MKNKDKFHSALKENKDQLNEIDLGEKLGIDENETRIIIARLLSEHKIEYQESNCCNYKLIKATNRRSRR